MTYASFRNASGQGGWSAGPSISASEADRQRVAEFAPTSLLPIQSFDDFIGSAEIAALPRRFEYRLLPEGALLMQSVPSGKDATGRPGNVFTHAVIDHDLNTPLRAHYPINFFGSPDLRTPFRAAAVNAVELPAGLGEPKPGPMADLMAAWMMVDDMYGNRRGALYRLQDALQQGRELPVLLLQNPKEAAYWLLALSSTLTPAEARRLLHFSTFERAATLPAPEVINGVLPVLVIPREDREQLAGRSGICLVDPADPATHAAQPQSSWSQLTAGLLADPVDPADFVQQLIETNEAVESSPTAQFQLGDGLARLVRKRAGKVSTELLKLAKQHLSQEPHPPAGAFRSSHQEDLALVERVIADPLAASRMPNGPILGTGRLSDHQLWTLVDSAAEGISALREASAAELIAYLDFLLHNRLILLERIGDPDFRKLFAGFPAMDQWRNSPLPLGAHPQLQPLLELAEQDTQALKRSRISAERVMNQLTQAQSVKLLVAWLEQRDTPAKLQRLLAEAVIENSTTDYSEDLLRVYYSVVMSCRFSPIITGDPNRDAELSELLTELAQRAVQWRLNRAKAAGREVALKPFQVLGRKIMHRDYYDIEAGSELMEQLTEIIGEHTSIRGLPFPRELNEIFAAVARGMISELRDISAAAPAPKTPTQKIEAPKTPAQGSAVPKPRRVPPKQRNNKEKY
ncbi:GAP1-N2 domain-containing protein [Corynebacterium sp. A21]|uniref:GAP1-N2 domain-containing protein n=1 Tax=Corynebacterium sp. A21 TaxID=3457318 RepID=UPI003FD5FCA0